MRLCDDQMNAIIRELVKQAIAEQNRLNEARDGAIAALKRTKALGMDQDSKGYKKIVKHSEKELFRQPKAKKVQINTPKMRSTLAAMGLTDKQASIIMHKATELKSIHDKAEKSLKYKKKYRIDGRKGDKSLSHTVTRENLKPFNDEDFTVEKVEERSKKAINKRKTMRNEKASAKDMLKLELSHGYKESLSTPFDSQMTATQPKYNTYSVPKGVKFKKECI